MRVQEGMPGVVIQLTRHLEILLFLERGNRCGCCIVDVIRALWTWIAEIQKAFTSSANVCRGTNRAERQLVDVLIIILSDVNESSSRIAWNADLNASFTIEPPLSNRSPIDLQSKWVAGTRFAELFEQKL